MEQGLRKKTSERMNGAVEALKKEFGAVRTGRATLALLDGIALDYYGTVTPLQQLASLSIPESRQIAIQPWEQRLIPEIEKAILKSDLGLTPMNDGKTIRINIPILTEERRKQLVKVVRNIRRDSNEELKKLEKDKHLSEDDVKKEQEEIQKLTDSFIKKIDEILEHKEKEIMEV